MNQKRTILFLVTLVFIFGAFSFAPSLHAQLYPALGEFTPDGNYLQGITAVETSFDPGGGEHKIYIARTDHALYAMWRKQGTAEFVFNDKPLYVAPFARDIALLTNNLTVDDIAYTLLSDGKVVKIRAVADAGGVRWEITQFQYELFNFKIDGWRTNFTASGTKLYVLYNGWIMSSRDEGATRWFYDSTGTNRWITHAIACTKSGYVFALQPGVANGRILRQDPDSIGWKEVARLNEPFQLLAENDSLFLCNYEQINNIYVSGDLGNTWNKRNVQSNKWIVDSLVIGTDGTFYGSAFSGHWLYRSTDRGTTWTEIRANLPVKSSERLEHSITALMAGEITLAATRYGLYASSDHGDSWKSVRSGRAENIGGFSFGKDGSRVIATGLGIFYNSGKDSLWQKTYPDSSYFHKMGTIFRDNAGRLYAKALLSGTDQKAIVISSTDNGLHWDEDTVAPFTLFNGVRNEPYYVDETGTQHIARYQYLIDNITIDVFARSPDSVWKLDEGGIQSRGGKTTLDVFCSNRTGLIYYSTMINSYSRLIWQRPVSGGAWTLDTAGLQRDAFQSMAANGRGGLVGGTWESDEIKGKLWQKKGDRWEKITVPQELSRRGVYHLGMADNGLIFADFVQYGSVHQLFCVENGAFRRVMGDTLGINEISVPAGDTAAYIATDFGLYRATRFGVKGSLTGIAEQKPLLSESLEIMPNPAENEVEIRVSSLFVGHPAEVMIVDVTGIIVKRLSFDAMPASIHLNGEFPAAGIYHLQVCSGGNVGSAILPIIR